MRQQPRNGNGLQNKNGEKSLAVTSQSNEESKAKYILEGQIRECYARVVYSHKTHEKCADILLDRQSTIKLWQIILSALITGGVISTIFCSGKVGATNGGILSTTLLILYLSTKKHNLCEIPQKNKK